MNNRNNIARPLALCLAALLLMLLGACAAGKGSTAEFDGFTVRTERAREAAEDGDARAVPAERSAPAQAEDYVLNMSSEKFHYPSCSAVGEISERNRWDYHGTREDIIEMGYQPCKLCNP